MSDFLQLVFQGLGEEGLLVVLRVLVDVVVVETVGEFFRDVVSQEQPPRGL